MKKSIGLPIVLVISVCITIFLYIIDSDPPYPEHWRTVLEFLFVTLVIFSISVVVYYLVYHIVNQFRKK